MFTCRSTRPFSVYNKNQLVHPGGTGTFHTIRGVLRVVKEKLQVLAIPSRHLSQDIQFIELRFTRMYKGSAWLKAQAKRVCKNTCALTHKEPGVSPLWLIMGCWGLLLMKSGCKDTARTEAFVDDPCILVFPLIFLLVSFTLDSCQYRMRLVGF